MGVLADRAFESCGILRVVAAKAEGVALLDQVGFIAIAVDVVAVEAATLAVVHDALHEVIALHAILVRGEIGVLKEVGCAWLELFKLPMIGKTLAREESY